MAKAKPVHYTEHSTQERGLVSVVMPMHNSERFIKESIESVLAQTYAHWELLIVDDASTDNSLAIASQYAAEDERIHLLRNTKHIKMPSAPRNAGVQAAKGQYIAFLDSDDLWFPQKLEQQLPFFKDNRTAIVFSNYEKIDELSTRANRVISAPRQATYKSLLKGNIIGNLTGIYDTGKVGKANIKDIHHEDYVMWLSILKKGYIARNTETTLAAYRVSSQSVSSNKLKVIKWQWDIYRNVEHLSLLRSAYNFVFYAYKALIKSLI
jgi:glycosyltransferase involved in cell wall biosynthesis